MFQVVSYLTPFLRQSLFLWCLCWEMDCDHGGGGLQMKGSMKGGDGNVREKDREGTMTLDMASVVD